MTACITFESRRTLAQFDVISDDDATLITLVGRFAADHRITGYVGATTSILEAIDAAYC